MNLKQPPVFLRIPTTTHTILSVRTCDIIGLEDRISDTVVTWKGGVAISSLSSQEIEDGMKALQQQQEEYEDKHFSIRFLGEDDE